MDLLQADEKLMDRFGEIKRLTGGLQALLDAVNGGQRLRRAGEHHRDDRRLGAFRRADNGGFH